MAINRPLDLFAEELIRINKKFPSIVTTRNRVGKLKGGCSCKKNMCATKQCGCRQKGLTRLSMHPLQECPSINLTIGHSWSTKDRLSMHPLQECLIYSKFKVHPYCHAWQKHVPMLAARFFLSTYLHAGKFIGYFCKRFRSKHMTESSWPRGCCGCAFWVLTI